MSWNLIIKAIDFPLKQEVLRFIGVTISHTNVLRIWHRAVASFQEHPTPLKMYVLGVEFISIALNEYLLIRSPDIHRKILIAVLVVSLYDSHTYRIMKKSLLFSLITLIPRLTQDVLYTHTKSHFRLVLEWKALRSWNQRKGDNSQECRNHRWQRLKKTER